MPKSIMHCIPKLTKCGIIDSVESLGITVVDVLIKTEVFTEFDQYDFLNLIRDTGTKIIYPLYEKASEFSELNIGIVKLVALQVVKYFFNVKPEFSKLKENKHDIVNLIKLLDPEMFESDFFEFLRYQVVDLIKSVGVEAIEPLSRIGFRFFPT